MTIKECDIFTKNVEQHMLNETLGGSFSPCDVIPDQSYIFFPHRAVKSFKGKKEWDVVG